jgi:DNA-3-methyladenine glycosylase
MNKRLTQEFFTQSAIELAPALLGKYLCRKIDGETIIRARITETEAYYGTDDTACHACKGKTERNRVMWEDGGFAYVYLCYGIHNMLNIVSGKNGFPEAVLIRGIEGFEGPGKLTKFLQITRNLNYENLLNSSDLWLEDGERFEFETSKRIGIDYADEKDKNKLWRWCAKL